MTAEEHVSKAAEYALTAARYLDTIKTDKRFGKDAGLRDAQQAAVATGFATLALYHQRAAEHA